MTLRLRSFAFYILMYLSGLLFSLAGVVFWALVPRRIAQRTLVHVPVTWARFLLASLRLCCGIRIELSETHNLPAGPCIIAAQHQSALDIFIWLAILPNPAMVFKQELAKIPLFGTLLVPAGMISVDRDGAAPALRKLVIDARTALANGRQIVIFPEGTRVTPGERSPLHPGIVALARNANAPVLPAATNSGLLWGKKAFHKKPGTVKVKLFPALEPNLRRDEIIEALTKDFYESGVEQAQGSPSGPFHPRFAPTEP